ncbi:hypothetical protein GCM10011519_02650 [Marmoricola endophyticus]|uniref:Uncharacterized protein n=1 Tax=Marmoricola endophyticus TaxID=2040280 RepID=A0A917EZ53_9ACTN|nr:hypothetical protein GCM10011519_02650 [Marmoricola endophyticus]
MQASIDGNGVLHPGGVDQQQHRATPGQPHRFECSWVPHRLVRLLLCPVTTNLGPGKGGRGEPGRDAPGESRIGHGSCD